MKKILLGLILLAGGILSAQTGCIQYRINSVKMGCLPIGSTGKILTVSGGLPSWQENSAIKYKGTTGYIPLFHMASGDSIINSVIFQSSSHINIGNGTPLYDDYLNISKNDAVNGVGICVTNNNTGGASEINMGEDASNRLNFLYFNSTTAGNYASYLPIPKAGLSAIRSVMAGSTDLGSFVIGGGSIYNVVRSGTGTLLDVSGLRIDNPSNLATANNPVVALEVVSTTQGVAFPRMTTTQKNAITAIEGLIVYDLDLHVYQFYNGTTWVTF